MSFPPQPPQTPFNPADTPQTTTTTSVLEPISITIRCPAIINSLTKDYLLPPLHPSQTLLDLKTLLMMQHPCHPALGEQRLIYKGKLLRDNLLPLSNLLNFDDGNSFVIHLVLPVVRYGSPDSFDDACNSESNTHTLCKTASTSTKASTTASSTSSINKDVDDDSIYLDGNNFYISKTKKTTLNIRKLKTINAYNTLLKRIPISAGIAIKEEIKTLRLQIQEEREDDEHFFDINIRLFELMNSFQHQHLQPPQPQPLQQQLEGENVRIIRIELIFILRIFIHIAVVIYLWWKKSTKLYMVSYILLMITMSLIQYFFRRPGRELRRRIIVGGAQNNNTDSIGDFVREAWNIVLGPFRRRRMMMMMMMENGVGNGVNGVGNADNSNTERIPLIIRITEFISSFILSMFPELPANLQ